MKMRSLLILTLSLMTVPAAASIIKTEISVPKNSRSTHAVQGKDHCVKGNVGALIFDNPGHTGDSKIDRSGQPHLKGSRVLVKSLDGRETIASILFTGPENSGGLTLALGRGRQIIVCNDGSFIF